MVFKLILTALYNAILAAIIYAADKKTPLGKLSYKSKQIITGVILGAMAAFASSSMGGVDYERAGRRPYLRGAYFRSALGNNRRNYRRLISLHLGVLRAYGNIYSARLFGFHGSCRHYSGGVAKVYV